MFLVFNVFLCTTLNQTQYACARFADHVVCSVAMASGGARDRNNPSGSTSVHLIVVSNCSPFLQRLDYYIFCPVLLERR